MPVIEAVCGACGARADELVPTLSTAPGPCSCGGARTKAFSLPIVVQRPWMTDEAIAGNNRHREWLRTPAAKAMNLEKVGDEE